MARRFATNIDLQQNELQRARIHNVVSDGSGVEGQVIWRSDTNELKIYDGSAWVTLPLGNITSSMITDGTIVNGDISASAGIVRSKLNFGSGLVDADIASGAAIAWTKINSAGQVTANDIAAAIKGGPAAGVEALRALGTTATTAAAGNDSRLSDSRAPNGSAGGDLIGSYPNPTIGLLKIDDTHVKVANKDGLAAVPSLRTLGTGSTQAAPGNDSRFGAASPPNGSAGGDLAGSYPNPTIGPLKIDDTMVKAANKDGVAGLPSMRTLGSGALQAAPGNDARFTDSRAPNGVAGGDLTGTYPNPTILPGVITDADVNPANKDGVAGTASMRTLGTGATQAAGGTHTLASHPAPIVALPMNGQLITGLANPVSAQDAATKAYVDASTIGLDVKASVRVASAVGVNVVLATPGATIDGITMAANDRVLLKDQTAPAENGIWVWNGAAVPMTRAADADISAEVTPGMFTFVEVGTNADSGWVLTTDSPIVLGTTALAFSQFSGAGSFTDGAGLVKSGNVLNVVGSSSITVNANDVQVATGGVVDGMIVGMAASKLTGMVPLANGGTAAASPAAARTNLGVAGKYDNAATHAAGTSITITAVTHGLGAGRNKIVQVIEEATGDVVETDINIASNGDVVVAFAQSQLLNTHRVLIMGW